MGIDFQYNQRSRGFVRLLSMSPQKESLFENDWETRDRQLEDALRNADLGGSGVPHNCTLDDNTVLGDLQSFSVSVTIPRVAGNKYLVHWTTSMYSYPPSSTTVPYVMLGKIGIDGVFDVDQGYVESGHNVSGRDLERVVSASFLVVAAAGSSPITFGVRFSNAGDTTLDFRDTLISVIDLGSEGSSINCLTRVGNGGNF